MIQNDFPFPFSKYIQLTFKVTLLGKIMNRWIGTVNIVIVIVIIVSVIVIIVSVIVIMVVVVGI